MPLYIIPFGYSSSRPSLEQSNFDLFLELSAPHSFKKFHVANMRTSALYSATLFSLAAFAFPALKSDISADTLSEITALAAKISTEAEAKQSFSNAKRALPFSADTRLSAPLASTPMYVYPCNCIDKVEDSKSCFVESTWSQ